MKKAKKMKQFNLVMPVDLKARAEVIAKEKNISLGELLRQSLNLKIEMSLYEKGLEQRLLKKAMLRQEQRSKK